MAKISWAEERDGEVGLAREGRTGHGAGDAGDGREAMIGGWMGGEWKEEGDKGDRGEVEKRGTPLLKHTQTPDQPL